MAKRPNHVLQKNAQTGSMTTWCPNCDRKAALGAVWHTDPSTTDPAKIDSWRTCRYCGESIRVKDQQIARRRREKESTNE